jgi:hypothetical protein
MSLAIGASSPVNGGRQAMILIVKTFKIKVAEPLAAL